MNTFQQIISAIYVALAEAAGGPAALHVANRVLRDAIADRAIDDPLAIEILELLSHDEDDAPDIQPEHQQWSVIQMIWRELELETQTAH